MKSNRMMKCLSMLLALAMVAGCFAGLAPRAMAAGYSGSGTMADPYLVTTAEQLQNMRENLTAHYRLANNIDLAGMDFKPIGRLSGPFTGSFICEQNEDGSPKYAIRNLTVTVAETPYATENNCRWEAGLFGCTDGATISGIVLFDVNVVNNVLGDNQGAVIYGTYKPGMDEMAAGALVGIARNTSISYCGSTGFVGGRANWTGGLLGVASHGSRVEYCFSTATVDSIGKWSVAGFSGGASKGDAAPSNFSYCYYSGSATGGTYGTASFTGSFNGNVFAYCVTEGIVSNQFVRKNGNYGATFQNCANLSKSEGAASEDSGADASLEGLPDITITDCYYDGAAGAKQKGFIDDATKAAEILEEVKSKVPWDVKVEDYLEDNPIISGGESDAPVQDNDAPQADLDAMIEAIPDPTDPDVFTVASKQAVMDAVAIYSNLSAGQKEDVSAELTGKLLKAHYEMSLLVVSALVVDIKALPATEELTAEHAEQIKAMYADYQFLEETVKVEMQEDVCKKLEAAYAQLSKLQSNSTVTVQEGLTGWEWTVVIFTGIVILLAVTFDVVAGILLVKMVKKNKKVQTEESVNET